MDAYTSHLLDQYPHIPWTEPIQIETLSSGQRYACRICIARIGLSGQEAARCPTTPDIVQAHIRAAHLEATS